MRLLRNVDTLVRTAQQDFKHGLVVCAGDRPLYQVLEQQAAQVQQGQLMGTDHTYVIPPTGDRRAANVKK